ncbi:protein phosphatase 1 regulatory subunit 37 [Echeneis naucrates]|uniref:Protein phosphatase 1 regulatory subunit 37 n=1 Tax=Echeneis naucrates TaxID=173247 RepID=A0A665UIG3_ECHNA|nr:protein phosphatase 1 regulatory subunit 37 [Echeneis naucrates]XP_029373897.1 protein phosphatase 1 regulatory subunit 37 [Echeneis naucrates]
MNIEEQCLDLCNVKTKGNVDDDHNSTNNTDAVSPWISELMSDSNTEKPNTFPTEASETYLMPQLTDNLKAVEEDNHQVKDTLEIDEVNGNRKSTVQETPLIANPANVFFSNDEQHKKDIGVEKMKEDKETDCVVGTGDDGGDMDMGVDLSLDESGVLDAVSTNIRSLSDSTSDSGSTSQDVPAGSTAESPSDASPTSSTEASATDQAGLYPLVEEGDNKQKPSGKRVTFPSDEDIVSGAVEPKDPWRHAQNVTVDEILSSYKGACQNLNCKPIPKVLKQIQELKDLTQRNECLDLKGEKLDYKACESLEEILKRVQFKVIDLEQTNLDEDGASALFDMIEYYESATHLNISFNKHIGTRGWQAAAHMMRKTSSLQYLDARNTPLLDHSAPFVARALRISGSLAVLHLENAGLSGRPLMLLATALKMNMNLRELYLADNKLNGLQDSAQLGNLLKFNYNIQILDLRNNHILDSGLAYVCEGLKEQRKGLVTLVLWNNQLTHNGMGYLAAALPCTQSLETLNLGNNSVGNEGVHKLKDGLIANRSVLRLGLASTKLSCEGAVAVAEFIAESPRLLRLDLRENEIKTGGLMALSLALKVNASLLRLDLDREPKKETVKSFIETQRTLLNEIQNGCKRNFILAKEKEETDQKMRQSASMAEIATEDGAKEQEEESALEEKGDRDEKEGAEEEVGETPGNDGETSSPTETSSEINISQLNLESDSDTEDEEEEEVVTKSFSTSNSYTYSNQTAPVTQTVAVQPPLSASCTASPQSPTLAGGTSVISGITVTESPVPPGTPPSPGRCISVSSPGRGHKIFMVTRVESPPEQQQLHLPISAPAAPSQTAEVSKKPVDTNTQQAQPLPAPQAPTQTQLTQEDMKQGSPAQLTDCKLTELNPVAHSQSVQNTTQTHTVETRCQPREDVTSVTLDPEVTDPSVRAQAQPSDSTPVQTAAFKLTEEGTGNTRSPKLESTSVGEKEQEEEAKDPTEDNKEAMSSESTGESKQLELSQTSDSIPAVYTQQVISAVEQLPNELASASEETQSPNQTGEKDKEEALADNKKYETPASLSENKKTTLTEKEDSLPNKEQTIAKQQIEADKQTAKSVLSVKADQQAQSVIQSGAQETNPEADKSVTAGSVCLDEEEDSPDESSADEVDFFAEALDGEVVGSALPNGLKSEFSLHLLDAESPKPSSCVMEHVSVSCGQDLEELLLEATLDTGRDGP